MLPLYSLLATALVSSVSAGTSVVSSGDGTISVTVGAAGIVGIVALNETLPISSATTTVGSAGTIAAPGSCTVVPGGAVVADIGSGVDAGAGGGGGGGDGSGGGVSVRQKLACTVPDASASTGGNGTVEVQLVVTDAYVPEASSVRIHTTIIAAGAAGGAGGLPAPFTAALRSAGLSWAEGTLGDAATVWLPWTKGCVQNSGRGAGMCYGDGAWSEALSSEPLPNATRRYRYGTPAAGDQDSFSLPIVSVLLPSAGVGVSLALSPEDPTLEVSLRTAPDGAAFDRELLRLGVVGGAPVAFSAHLVAHADCYRPALQFYTSRFPAYFEPWLAPARIADFEGLGSYSWNQEPYNATRARALGFKTNWDLSGTFMPYDGLFLPYEPEWPNLGPINGGLAQYVTRSLLTSNFSLVYLLATDDLLVSRSLLYLLLSTRYNVTLGMINAYYEGVQAAGFHSLSYFDIGNWGTRTDTNYRGPAKFCGTRPAGPHTPSPNGTGSPNAPCPDPDGGNAYLRDVLWPALLHHGWSLIHGKFTVHKTDWVGTTDMDTQEPVFEDLIIEQAARHLAELPAFEGIAIDRLDYSQYFNYDADDGVSWVPVNCTAKNASRCADYAQWSWGAARALRLSYRHTYERLHELLHGGGDSAKGAPGNKVMLQNCNWLCRIDEFRAFDGSFSEGAALNSVAFTGLRGPTILWTYALSSDRAVLDAFFQQHVSRRPARRTRRCDRWSREWLTHPHWC